MKVCLKPFQSAEFHLGGDVYVCCPNWMRRPIGNLSSQSIEEIWNSQAAKEIRESIIDGSFRYCDKTNCPFLLSDTLPSFEKIDPHFQNQLKNKTLHLEKLPEEIMLNYDLSCNLSCPSCRTKLTVHNPGTSEHSTVLSYTDKIFNEFLAPLGDDKLVLNITGSGDPLASHVYRDLLEKLEGREKPNLRIELQTNGLLFTPHNWNKLHKIWNNIDRIFVSIDAATEETYIKVRRGGNWATIQSNMKFLCDLRKKDQFKYLQANLVVQKTNYKEMPSFTKMFLDMGCDVVSFSLLNDWSTWPKDIFNDQLVWRENHPEYRHFLKVLSDDVFLNPKVFIGNLAHFRSIARKEAWKKKDLFQKMFSFLVIGIYELRRRKFFVPGIIQNFFRK